MSIYNVYGIDENQRESMVLRIQIEEQDKANFINLFYMKTGFTYSRMEVSNLKKDDELVKLGILKIVTFTSVRPNKNPLRLKI